MAVKLFSQQNNPQQTPPPPPNNQTQQIQQPIQQGQTIPYNANMKNSIKAEKYKNLKIGGIVLLTAGVVGLIGGIAMVSSGVSNQISTNSSTSSSSTVTTTPYGTTTSTNNSNQPIAPANAAQISGGVFLGVLGAFAIGGGTAMAIIGSHKQKKYAAASRLSMAIAPTAFSIAYKF